MDTNFPELDGQHVRMKDKARVIEKIRTLLAEGKEKLQIIADFDRTISKHHHNGVTTRSSYSVFEAIPTLPKEFLENAAKLYNKFRVIEDDPHMTVEQKLPYMEEWWRLNEKLFPGIPYSEKQIEQAVVDSDVHLRIGSKEAFEKLRDAQMPVLVFSAGLGHVVSAVLKHYNILFDNMHVISNFFDIRDNTIVGFKGTLLHVYNKNQHAIENLDYFKDLAHRGNVILLGDSLGDAGMDEGVQNKGTVIKIGFLNVNIEEFLPQYMDHFDIVLVDDQTMDVFNGIVDRLLKK